MESYVGVTMLLVARVEATLESQDRAVTCKTVLGAAWKRHTGEL